jgi:hypothetical protein
VVQKQRGEKVVVETGGFKDSMVVDECLAYRGYRYVTLYRYRTYSLELPSRPRDLDLISVS